MIQPSARRASAPAPLAKMSGTAPSTAAAMVIITGRKRVRQASRMAASTLAPSSRRMLANSTMRMPFLAMTPTSSTRPIWL